MGYKWRSHRDPGVGNRGRESEIGSWKSKYNEVG